MPTLAVAEASNAAFSPNYIPVAIVVGGTSGVGHAMAEALAHQTRGRAHIIIIGRNARTAEKILASFPKPEESDFGWAHEFVQCDGESMASVRAVCAELSARLTRINFLVITAGGPAANSLTASRETPEGLDAHLAMRYFMRYIFTKSLLPLLVRAREMGQHAHVMTVLGAGFGITIPKTDLGNDDARRRSIKLLQGVIPSFAAAKGLTRGVTYNDGLVAYFAAQHPDLAFTHIAPGQVLTPGGSHVELGWLFAPLAWVLGFVKRALSVTQAECAQYMLYALLTVERGLFIRGQRSDIVGAHVFDPHSPQDLAQFDPSSSTAQKSGVLHGVPIKGYGGSDASVARLVAYTEEVLAKIA
ncbi:hypothetical protein B0H11DRAFT_2284920 [Mycena galericulata]|nr:hypothetical protein B0H11DRAFT_2284920 [Mycena galericulata]